MIAALFVERDGVYSGLPGVDVWDVDRDARKYDGPWPVVAHPPCERWGRYWSGGPSAKVRRTLGDDGGCFESAIKSVIKFGGVLEHPEGSHAFKAFEISRPPKSGGWVFDGYVGSRESWICCVEQGHYGHPARKATWLYYVTQCVTIVSPEIGQMLSASQQRPSIPDLIWGPSQGQRLDEGFHSKAERDAARASGIPPRKRLSKAQNVATPIPFRDLLLSIARSARLERSTS